MASSRQPFQWNKTKITARIRALRKAGKDLSYNHIAAKGQGLLSAANYHFGSWREAVEAAGIDYDGDVRRIPKWTRERIVATIRAAQKAGQDLCWSSVSKHPKYSGMAYGAIRNSKFGSWDAALAAAQVEPAGVRRYESWNEEKVIARIKQRAQAGLEMNSKSMQEQDCKLFNAALKRFQKWQEALKAAGIEPEAVYKRRHWDKAQIRDEVRALWKSGADLAAPGMRRERPALYSAAIKYFGSWTAARMACGIRKNFRKRKPRRRSR